MTRCANDMGDIMPTIEQRGLTFDARPDRIDFRDLEYRAPLISLEREYPSAPLVDKYLPKYCDDGMILNQGEEGACTGFGLAAVINYLYWERAQRSNGAEPPPRVSTRMLYQMARLYDEWDGEDYEGSSCRGAMKGWHHHGVCTEELWPYGGNGRARFVQPTDGWDKDAAERPLGAYYRINKDSLLEMQAAIGEVHAIYASATVHEGWWLKKTNQLTAIAMEGKKEVGGHAFAIVGYRPDGFIIQNSWGPRWGYRGFAVLTYPDWLQNGMDAWVAVPGAPAAVKGSPVACPRKGRTSGWRCPAAGSPSSPPEIPRSRPGRKTVPTSTAWCWATTGARCTGCWRPARPSTTSRWWRRSSRADGSQGAGPGSSPSTPMAG